MDIIISTCQMGTSLRMSNMEEEPNLIHVQGKGGWISRDALKHDEEIMTEVMHGPSQRTSKDGLNPFRAQSGEILPLGVERNSNGLLV